MPYNGSGGYLRSHNWQTDKANTIPVTASRMDTEHDGFATGLSTVICRDGQSTTTARIPFALGVDMYDGGPTNATLGLRFIGDPDSGFYRSAANTWHLVAGGVTAVTLSNTQVQLPVPLIVPSISATSAEFTGNLSCNGDFDVNTSAFTVDGATGNTTVLGTLAVGGQSFNHTATTATAAGALMRTTHVKSGGVGVNSDATCTWDFWGEDTAGTSRNLARFDVVVEDAAALGMDAFMRWRVMSANALANFGIVMSGEGQTFRPNLGSAIDLGSLSPTVGTWRNLYLTGAATISFGATSDVTITHSSNLLTVNGGVMEFNDGITVNGSSTFSVNSGSGVISIGGDVVLEGRKAAVPDASGGTTIDTQARTAINTLLARIRDHGMIAP